MMFFLAACAPDLAENHRWDDGEPLDVDVDGESPRVSTQESEDGWTSVVDAQDSTAWVGLDLDQGLEVNPTVDSGWDLRFQRFHMSVNGGVSGTGGVEVHFAPGLELSLATFIPDGPWWTDAPDGDDEDSHPDYALFTWYDYNEETHVLTPMPGVWFVRTTEGDVYGLSLTSYYNEVGSSAVPSFDWLGPVGRNPQ